MESPLASPLIPDYEPPDPSVTLPRVAGAASKAGIKPDEHHAAAVQSDATGLPLRRPVPSMEDIIRANRLAAVARVNPELARELSRDPVAAVAAAEHADDIIALSRTLVATTPGALADQLRGQRISAGAIRDEIEPFVKPRVRDIWEAFEFGYNTQVELGELGYRMWMGEDPGPLMARVEWIERKWAGTEEASGLGYFFHRSAEQSPQWVKGQERALGGAATAVGIKRGIQHLAKKWAVRKGAIVAAGPLAPAVMAGMLWTDAKAAAAGYSAGAAYRTFEMYTGSAYLEMSRLTDKDGNKIDPTLARALAATVGAINAPLGAAQIANIGDMLGGRKLRGQAARRFGRAVLGNETIRRRLFGIAERFGKDITLQAASELGQEFVAGAGAEMVMIIDQSFGEADEERQDVFSRAFDSSLRAAASSVVPGLWRAGRSAPGAIIQGRQAAAIREAHREIGEIAEGTGLKTKSPEILTRMLQSRGADSIMIIDGREVQDMLRDKVVSEDLAKIGITKEMADESVTFGHGIRFHSASLMANARNDVAQRVLDRSRLLGSRMLLEDATPEKVTTQVQEDAARAGNIAEHIDVYNRRLGLMQRQMAKVVEQSALLGRQVAAAGVKPSDYAAQVVRLVDGYAKRHAMESGEDLNAILSRIVTKYARRGEALPAVQERMRLRPSVSAAIGEGPTGHDVLNTIAEIGPMRRPRKTERGGEFDAIREGQTRLRGPYARLLAAEGMGADQMAQALQSQGIGDGTVDTMWSLVDQALETRKQARADAAEGVVTDLGEAEAAGLVREGEATEAADDVPFATDDLFEGLTEEELAIGMRDMVDDLGTGMFGDDDVTMFQAVDPATAMMADTIEIDGVQRPTLNSEGQRIGRTEQEVRNFWRWFGDSKVVDEQGRPLVVYSGQPVGRDVFSGVDRSEIGGVGFFTDTEHVAELYAGRAESELSGETDFSGGRDGEVGQYYLRLEKPWNPDETGDKQKAKWLHAAARKVMLDYDNATNEDRLYEGWSYFTDKYKSEDWRLARDYDPDLSFGEWIKTASFYEYVRLDLAPLVVGQGNFSEGIADTTHGALIILEPELFKDIADRFEYDGIIYADAEHAGTTTLVATDSSQIKSATGNIGTFDPSDPSVLRQSAYHGTEGFDQRQRAFDEKPRGSMTIASDRYIIEVFENANMSTILHELGHVFLEETRSLIDAGLAGEQTQKDWTTLQGWMGCDWSAMTTEQKVQAHEKFARAFETYLMEGKAPTLALERPFSRFREWLLSVYRNAQNIEAETGQELNVNDEIRGVMDRMIASEQAIHEAKIVNGQTRVGGQEYQHLSLTPEEQAELNELLDVAFEAGKSRLVQDRERDLPRLIRGWRAEARRQIEASEAYQALRDTRLRSEGLNADDVRAMGGQEAVTDLRRRGIIAKTGQGMDPNAIAGRFGMEDGAAFIQMLRNTPPINRAIAATVQTRVHEYMASIPIDEALIDTDAQAAAMDKIRDLIASRHERGRDAVKIRAEALRELARVRMRDMSLERVLDTAVFAGDYQRHMTEERNLLRKAASKPGKVDRADTIGQALAAHDKAKLAMEMLRLAREVRGEVDAAMKTIRMAKEKPSKTRTAKGQPHRIGYQWRENILHLANRAGLVDEKLFVQSDRQPLSAILTVDDPIHEMGPEFSDDLLSDVKDIPYLEMNIDGWRELSNLLEHLKHRGIQEVKDEVFRGEMNREELVGQLQAALDKHKDRWTWNENNPLRKVVNFVDGLMAGRLQLLYILRAADGYTNLGLQREAGPFETHLYDRVERAYDVEQRTMQEVRESLDPHMRQLEKSMLERPHTLDLPVPFPAQGSPAGVQRNWTYERLVSVALNCGNRYQLDALARGYGWGEMVTVDDMTGRQEWQTDMETINALLGSLTADDLKAVQGIWNSINSLWGRLSAVHKRRFGFAPVKVDATPITVTASDGTAVEMEGGYYPMMFDRSIDRRHEQQQAAEDLLVSNTNLLPTAKTYSGFMTERIGSGGKPIRLDFGVMIEHLVHTAKYIAYTETVLDIAKVLGDGRFSNPTDGQFIKKFGANIYKQIMPALADTARVSREHKDTFDRIFDWARGNATRYMLGLNPQTAVRQLSATVPGIERVGAGNYLAGLLRVIKNPVEAVRYMRENSTVMRARWQSQDREVRDQIRSTKGRYGTLWRIGRKMGIPTGAIDSVVFGAIQVLDYITATPVWYGAYRRAVHDGMSHEDAVLTANKDVVDTQSMARPFDLSAYQRSQKGYIRLFTSFMTFLMRSGNQAWLYDHGMMAGKIKGTTYARYFIINRIAQPLLELMLLDLAQGRIRGLLDGEEEDWKRYSFTALQWQFIGMPGIRELVDAAAYHTGGAGFRPRGLPSPSFVPWDLLNNLMRESAAAMEDDTRYERALMAWAHMLSFSMGVPASRIYDRLSEGLRQYDEEMDADLRNILWPNPDLRRRNR